MFRDGGLWKTWLPPVVGANGSTFCRYAHCAVASTIWAPSIGRDRCALYVRSTCHPPPPLLNCSFIRVAVLMLPAIFCRAIERSAAESRDAAAAGGGGGCADGSYPNRRATAPIRGDCRFSDNDPRTASRNGLNSAVSLVRGLPLNSE